MNMSWDYGFFEDLYNDDEYYIYRNKLNNKVYFCRFGEGAGGFVRIDKDEVPDDILCEVSKKII